MDELDQLILNSYSTIIIRALGIGTGNRSNSIHVHWNAPQEPDVVTQPPFDRIIQWCLSEELDIGNRQLSINHIPEGIDANQIALWLARELKKQGKSVQLSVWVARDTFVPVQID